MDYLIAGISNVQISKELSMTPQQVSNVRRSTVFQDQLAQRRAILTDKIDSQTTQNTVDINEIVNAKLKNEAIAAVEKLCDLRDNSEVDSVARASASDLLDRGGFPKLQKIENSGSSVFVIDKSDLSRIEKALYDDRPETIEAELVEIEPVSTNKN
jgi:hypothetical protein